MGDVRDPSPLFAAACPRLLSHQTEPLSHLGTDIESSPPFELPSPPVVGRPPPPHGGLGRGPTLRSTTHGNAPQVLIRGSRVCFWKQMDTPGSAGLGSHPAAALASDPWNGSPPHWRGEDRHRWNIAVQVASSADTMPLRSSLGLGLGFVGIFAPASPFLSKPHLSHLYERCQSKRKNCLRTKTVLSR